MKSGRLYKTWLYDVTDFTKKKLHKAKKQKFQFAKKLRLNETPCERILWMAFRDRGLVDKWQIQKQVVIGKYIADFVFKNARIVVEVDGSFHEKRQQYDKQRDETLNRNGYRVIRVTNSEVSNKLGEVIARLAKSMSMPAITKGSKQACEVCGVENGPIYYNVDERREDWICRECR